jgi:hypothetical protein
MHENCKLHKLNEKTIKTLCGLSPRANRRTERPPLSAKLVPTLADRELSRSQRGDPLRPYSRFSRPESLLFLQSSSSFILTRLNGPRY